MAYPPLGNDLADAKSTILNILKMEGYKVDSGSLFLAFKEAGGEMSQFAPSLEELQDEKMINSDSDGNIMTVEEYQREKSQSGDEVVEEEKEVAKDEGKDVSEDKKEVAKDKEDKSPEDEDIETMLQKKDETDTWIVNKIRNGSKTNEALSIEVGELKKRIEKIEKLLEKINEAFK
jgi:hypothetical protein